MPTSGLFSEFTPSPPSTPPSTPVLQQNSVTAVRLFRAGEPPMLVTRMCVPLTGYVAPSITSRGREWTTVAADPRTGGLVPLLAPPRIPMLCGGMEDERFLRSPAASGRRSPPEGPPAKCSMCPRDQDRRRGPREKEKGGGKRFRFGPCHVESQTTSSLRMYLGLQKTFE